MVNGKLNASTMYFYAHCLAYIYLPVPKAHVANSKPRAIRKHILIHFESENKHISFVIDVFCVIDNLCFNFYC